MLRVESNTTLEDFIESELTEYEEDILFDEDDPDFIGEPEFNGETLIPMSAMPLLFTVRGNMSIASVHHPGLHPSHSSLPTLNLSLEEITESQSRWNPGIHNDHILTIEEVRYQMTTCFSCGVSWNDSHVSLDCRECGGYPLERPCPVCEGACGSKWKRDQSGSHSSGKACWQGECAYNQRKTFEKESTAVNSVSQELSSKLEKLSANS